MRNHFTCHICGPDFKYVFYKEYDNLEKHFRISHYYCEDENCKAKKFVAFATAAEFDVHNNNVHTSNPHQKHIAFNAFQYGGFRFDDGTEKRQRHYSNEIKDREGLEFENQFLSRRKQKMIITHVDDH